MLRLALTILVVVACGSDPKPADPPPASDVGKVIELTGKVTATRDANIRTLAVGNGVRGDDVIETAADSSVVIELLHNNARWSIESDLRSRVDASVAWTVPKQDAARPVEHATSSAGRHADRQAANTQISAEADVDERKADAAARNAAAQNEADREAAKAKLGALRKEKADMADRIAAAKATAAKSERKKGVKISKECMDNPLSRACDGGVAWQTPEDVAVKSALDLYRNFANELCACTDAACAKQVDDTQGTWRAALDNRHPPSSSAGKAIAAGSTDTAKRYLECRRRLVK